MTRMRLKEKKLKRKNRTHPEKKKWNAETAKVKQ